MAKYDFKLEKHPTTGEAMNVATMTGKLISMSKEAIPNAGGTLYHPATVEFEHVNGTLVKSSAMIYKSNADYGMEVGNSYLGKVIVMAGKQPLIVLSHLDRDSAPTLDMFGLDVTELVPVEFDAITTKK